ncbi:MAG: phasin family protein [Alcanivoracaceae bacterium]|nr:phasin family protein [Alcanivoracaceae bacterium]
MSESQEQTELKARIEEAREDLKAAADKLQAAARGALSRIEGGATGLFEDLVKAGEAFEKQRSKGQKKKTTTAKKADASRVESIANRAVGALGLPTSDDMQALNKKLDSLSRKLRKLEKATAA